MLPWHVSCACIVLVFPNADVILHDVIEVFGVAHVCVDLSAGRCISDVVPVADSRSAWWLFDCWLAGIAVVLFETCNWLDNH